jgi:3-hydroxybutyryl-CoA dehydrogenase
MNVGVVGAGTMGAGIAQASLMAGHDVLLFDSDPAALERGRERIEQGLRRSVERGRLKSSALDGRLAALRIAPDLETVARESDLVIEAAIEDLEVKHGIFRVLDMHSLPDVPLATNTSSLSVAEIAAAVHHPERVLGLHFFNPAPVMALVEVVATDATSKPVIEAGLDFASGLDKTPILCSDAPGFVVNRVNRPFTLEALRMAEAGVDVGRIDAAVQAAGYPMGPFRLMDLVGIDVNLAVARSLYAAFDEAPRFRPSPLQEEMVAAGRLGQKTRAGFYAYDDSGKATEPAPLPSASATAAPRSPSDGDILDRIELAIINEAYRAVEERVASPQDVDLALKLGASHPYGPFERAGQLGLRRVIEGLRMLDAAYADQSGDQFQVAPLLWQLATA